MKWMMWLAALLVVGGAIADPVKLGTKKELDAAKALIDELVDGESTPEELVSMAGETNKGPERYWLYVNAFSRNVKAGKYAAAVDTLDKLRENVSGISDADVISLIDKYAKKASTGGTEIAEYVKGLKYRIAAQKTVVQLTQKVRRNPGDELLKISLVEAQAVSGDWKSALKTLSETKGDGAAAAKDELSRKPTVKTATFWWNYKPGRAYSGSKVFRRHGAEIFKKLLEGGKLSALDRTLAEKRVTQITEAEGELKVAKESVAKREPVLKNDRTREVPRLDPGQICSTQGLLHRWRFNGSMKDEVGSEDGQCHGEAKVLDRELVIPGGYGIDGNNVSYNPIVIPNDGSPITLEFWVTHNKHERTARIFTFGHWSQMCISMSWATEEKTDESFVYVGGGGMYCGKDIAPFEIGKEYHLAFELEPRKNDKEQWDVRIYKQDAHTGETLAKFEMPLEKGFNLKDYKIRNVHLGMAYVDKTVPAANASYNEFRIWNRALSEEELTQNAIMFHKAGETIK